MWPWQKLNELRKHQMTTSLRIWHCLKQCPLLRYNDESSSREKCPSTRRHTVIGTAIATAKRLSIFASDVIAYQKVFQHLAAAFSGFVH